MNFVLLDNNGESNNGGWKMVLSSEVIKPYTYKNHFFNDECQSYTDYIP